MLQATGQPYIIMGDFNVSARQVDDWLHTNHWLHAVVLEFGATCLGKADLDFMLVSRPLMHQCTELLRHKTTLATHDPISLQLSRPDDPEYHYEAWEPPKRVVVEEGPRLR
jgi:endonuclease/exonuclease/phosphatase family metal-dependent hydrolase